MPKKKDGPGLRLVLTPNEGDDIVTTHGIIYYRRFEQLLGILFKIGPTAHLFKNMLCDGNLPWSLHCAANTD
jgi:hypothetical protein